ncbi:MAG TPA: nuclear transport factor 2 family protein [Gemmatimonadales bacterium]|nr:nuclear transport factor 2 family protein [Gemmatimonadales bacterium]
MKAAALVTMGLFTAACAASGPPAHGPAPSEAPPAAYAAAREIMKLEEAWGRALSARDTAFFRQILADDFVGTGGAEVRSKQAVIEDLTKSVGAVPVPRLENTQVRLFDDVAIVTGIAVYEGSSPAPASRTRFTEVWARRGGRWVAVHGHYNAVPGGGS